MLTHKETTQTEADVTSVKSITIDTHVNKERAVDTTVSDKENKTLALIYSSPLLPWLLH